MVFTNTDFKSKGANDEMLQYGSEHPHSFKKGMERLDFFSMWPRADIPIRWNKDGEVADINVVLILCELLHCKNW